MRGRYYNTDIHRFINEDPIKDGLNWYGYGNGNPVMYVDIHGKEAVRILEEGGKATLTVIEGGGGAATGVVATLGGAITTVGVTTVGVAIAGFGVGFVIGTIIEDAIWGDSSGNTNNGSGSITIISETANTVTFIDVNGIRQTLSKSEFDRLYRNGGSGKLPSNTINAGKQGSKTWNNAVKAINAGQGKGNPSINVFVETREEALKLIKVARPNLIQMDKYTMSSEAAFEIHPAEPNVEITCHILNGKTGQRGYPTEVMGIFSSKNDLNT